MRHANPTIIIGGYHHGMAGRPALPLPTAGLVGQTEISRENRTLRDLVEVYRHLSGLAVQHADITTVAQLIADRTGTTVAVISENLGTLAAASPEHSYLTAADHVQERLLDPRLGQALSAAGQSRRALRLPRGAGDASLIIAPILVGDDIPAYVMTFDSADTRSGEDTTLLLTEHAATICGVILGRDRVVAASAHQAREDLLAGLLAANDHDPDEALRWARHLGYDPDRDHRVLSVTLDAPDAAGTTGAALVNRACAAAERFFTHRVPRAITSMRATEVVVVLPEADGPGGLTRAGQLSTVCVHRMGALFPDAVVWIGVGGVCRAPAEIARSYGEARRTIETLYRMGRRGGVLEFDELGIHRLLLQVPNLAELRGFAASVLANLDQHEHGRAYLATLACYFRENNSPQRASRILHLHPNTVTYRIKRVEEIAGIDLSDYRQRLMAQVALEIMDVWGDGG
jgi:sugar diacid utilization regulator